jgi:chromate reductase
MITLVIGTNRPGSNTAKVAAEVVDIYRKKDIKPEIIDLAKLPPEIFSPSCYETKPASFAPMADAILKADGIVWVTPEYNGSLPGVAKYFIDMLKFPDSLKGVPMCLVGLAAGEWGALRPTEQLKDIFIYRNALVYPERVFMPKVNDLLDKDGKINNPEIIKRLEKQAANFLQFVEKNKSKK